MDMGLLDGVSGMRAVLLACSMAGPGLGGEERKIALTGVFLFLFFKLFSNLRFGIFVLVLPRREGIKDRQTSLQQLFFFYLCFYQILELSARGVCVKAVGGIMGVRRFTSVHNFTFFFYSFNNKTTIATAMDMGDTSCGCNNPIQPDRLNQINNRYGDDDDYNFLFYLFFSHTRGGC